MYRKIDAKHYECIHRLFLLECFLFVRCFLPSDGIESYTKCKHARETTILYVR